MSRIVLGNCLEVMPTFPAASVDFILTDPPYLVNYKDRTGRSIAGDVTGDWLGPAFAQMHRVLRNDTFCVSFYGWQAVDQFMAAWRAAGFRIVGHLVFAKSYSSCSRFLKYQHESAYLLAKGRPAMPEAPLADVLPWKYTGNRYHPTQKPVECLRPLVESFSPAHGIVLDPFAGSGSTCVAARDAGRRYLGIELDPKYHTAAAARLAQRSELRMAA